MIAAALDKMLLTAKMNGLTPTGIVLGRGVRRMLGSELKAHPDVVPLKVSSEGWGVGAVVETYAGLPITPVDSLCLIEVVTG